MLPRVSVAAEVVTKEAVDGDEEADDETEEEELRAVSPPSSGFFSFRRR